MFPWHAIAREELGQAEVAGSAHNPRILEYHAATDLHATDDETPWCSAFVCWCLERAGLPTTRNALALSWRDYGVPSAPVPGAIAVQDRGGGRGHVGFVDLVHDGDVHLLAGNASNRVMIKVCHADSFVAFRMPVLEAP